jgi:hypothetical protein
LDVLHVDRMNYQSGMRVILGCVAFAQLFVLWIARVKDIACKSSCESREVGVGRLRDGKRRDPIRKAGSSHEWEKRARTPPQESAPIHCFPFK